jgi:curved DNA-binding protein CbpA
MSQDNTHYDNLQVAPTASQEVIRAAYRCLSQKLHPDRNPPELRTQCERVMQMVNEAYAVLSDAAAREAYDRALAERLRDVADADATRARQAQSYASAGGLGPDPEEEFDEHAAYELIDKELEGKKVDRGFWLKAFVMSGGDPTLQKLRYIEIRLAELRTIEKARFALELGEKRAAEQARRAGQTRALKAVFTAGSRLDLDEIEKLAQAAASDKTLLKTVDRVRGNTLLHLAAEADLGSAVEFLLRQGARADVKNQSGRRPYEVCNDAALARLLRNASATKEHGL